MYIADLHIHSKYSRATSRDCDLMHLDLWARKKGVGLLGTGDFTHPAWREEMQTCLEEDGAGLYRLRKALRLPLSLPGEEEVRFVISGEISTIYKWDGKTRKVHHLILLPSLQAAQELSRRLEIIGNIHSDGRPILGLDSRDLIQIVFDACPEAVFIPAHIWTPHFSVFGAFSAFSSLEECYGPMAGRIHALETGLSSDPPMNRMLSSLDGYQLVSNSDAHSPARIAREANLLAGTPSYAGLRRALETGDGLMGTIEFFPEEGKYHLDGHRRCQCCLEPAETAALGERLAKALHSGSLVLFTGGLGAGKTAFCEGVARGLGCTDEVSSPTFAIVNVYRGPQPFAHFDMYRISTMEDLQATGFFDYLDDGAVVAAEWSENVAPLVAGEPAVHVDIAVLDEHRRRITIEGAQL